MFPLSSSQIEAMLRDALPDECELAGEAHITTVSSVVASGATVPLQEPSRAGLRLSPEAALLAVAAAANFVKACVEIYVTMTSKGQTNVGRGEHTAKTLTQGAGVGESVGKLAAAVYKALSQS